MVWRSIAIDLGERGSPGGGTTTTFTALTDTPDNITANQFIRGNTDGDALEFDTGRLLSNAQNTKINTLITVQDSGTEEGTGIETLNFDDNLAVDVSGTTATITGSATGTPMAATAFTALTDTPTNIGTARQRVQVNADASGLEFVDGPGDYRFTGAVSINSDITITSANVDDYNLKIWLITAGSHVVNINAGSGLTYFGVYVRRLADTGTLRSQPATNVRVNNTASDVVLDGRQSATYFAITADRYQEVFNNFRPENFINLADTPSTLGTTGQLLAVNAAADELEFIDAPLSGASNFLALTDTPAVIGTASQLVRVNSDADALEFADPSSDIMIPATSVTIDSRRLTGLLSSASNAQTAFDRIDATGIGASIRSFTGSYVANNANQSEWLNRHLQGADSQTNARRTFTLPATSDLTTAFNALMTQGVPELIRITISYLGGPSNSFVTNNLNVAAASSGPAFGFSRLVNLIRNDSVTLEIRRTGSTIGTWQEASRGILQSESGNDLDDLQFRGQVWNAMNNSVLPGTDDVLQGYSFRVINAPANGSGRFSQVMYNGDWVVWTARTFTAWSDTQNWIVIAASDVRRISAVQANFLNTISDRRVITAGNVISRVRFWLLDTLPTAAPLLTAGQTGSFTSASAITNRFLLVAVPNTNRISDIVLQNSGTNTTALTDFAPSFVDYASVIPDNSNGSYYLLGTSTTAGTPFTLAANNTLTLRQRMMSSQYRADSQFKITRDNLDATLLAAIFP